MKRRDFIVSVAATVAGASILSKSTPALAKRVQGKPVPIVVIHGGTSGMNLTEKEFDGRKKVMEASLLAAQAIITKGGSAEDAVIEAIKIMEDSPLFNAGKGAVFNASGVNELDASIMLGNGRRAGAVTGVTTVKNPILAAKLIMEKTKHTLVGGAGADDFAKKNGLTTVDQKYFYTDFRYKALQDAKKEQQILLDSEKTSSNVVPAEPYLGTVGAIALDKHGNLAAGTSTGGMTNKMAGRIGDSPIIGAGNYADRDVAVSCTGTGDIFIRVVAAHEVAALYEYGKLSITKAAENTIAQVKEMGGTGGIISIDKYGNPGYAWTRKDLGMYHGQVRIGEKPEVFFPVQL
ncbi:MAG: isoaspartyl peptidase/L-asparaginase family protein [Desulfovibrionaceae bacterium]